MLSLCFRKRRKGDGAALIIVLAFVVLLSALIVAYVFQSRTDRQLAKSSFDDANADLLARSALDIIVGDFKQEVADGSISSGAFVPRTNDDLVPRRSGNPAFTGSEYPNDPTPNLIRISVYPDLIAAYGVASRASAVNSTTDVSLNGRSVALERWNNHYLLPRHDPTSGSGSTPMSPLLGDSTGFSPPNWVLVTRNGPMSFASWQSSLKDSTSTNNNFVVGRYAYAVYDEGGLLDINVAGYPTSASNNPTVTDIGRKGVLAFADLTVLPTSGSGTMSSTAINRFVGFRNYATTQLSSTSLNFSFTTACVSCFVNYYLGSPQIGTNQDFGLVNRVSTGSGSNIRTDESFITRFELIATRSAGAAVANPNTLQYLGTFSRERNRSTWGNSITQLASRFPLSRFEVFAATPPSIANTSLIQTYFGLLYVPAVTSPAPIPEHWQYVGMSGATLQATIPSITGTNQSPDFFPLVQYALPSASIGEILSIGASLIDQRDPDPNTTWIEYGDLAAPQKAWGADQNPPPNPTDPRPSTAPVMLGRAFRNVGELGYAYRNGTTSLDFRAAGSVDAPLLDLFTYDTASTRSGIVNLNSRQPHVLAAILRGAITSESSSTIVSKSNSDALNAARSIVNATGVPGGAISGRQDVARLASSSVVTTTPFNATGTTAEEIRETIARALAEVGQTRTWGLMIDIIAQSGRYPPSANGLANFVVEGEKHYWLHIAIDRFTGEVIDRQLEAVYE
jgi:hypothetical protein